MVNGLYLYGVFLVLMTTRSTLQVQVQFFLPFTHSHTHSASASMGSTSFSMRGNLGVQHLAQGNFAMQTLGSNCRPSALLPWPQSLLKNLFNQSHYILMCITLVYITCSPLCASKINKPQEVGEVLKSSVHLVPTQTHTVWKSHRVPPFLRFESLWRSWLHRDQMQQGSSLHSWDCRPHEACGFLCWHQARLRKSGEGSSTAVVVVRQYTLGKWNSSRCSAVK